MKFLDSGKGHINKFKKFIKQKISTISGNKEAATTRMSPVQGGISYVLCSRRNTLDIT